MRKRSYANDIVWRVPFRDRAAGDAESAWLHLILMIEVQGTVDHLMALRLRNYVDNHHMELWRGRRFGATDRLAPVLPIVIYTGKTRWTAARRVIDLVTPSAARQAEPDLTSWTNELFAGDGYLTLDTSEWRSTIFRATMPQRCWPGSATRPWNACRRTRRNCGRCSMIRN